MEGAVTTESKSANKGMLPIELKDGSGTLAAGRTLFREFMGATGAEIRKDMSIGTFGVDV